MFTRILVPVDGSATSDKAVQTAVRLARESGGRARLVHCFDALGYMSGFEYSADVMEQARAYAERTLKEAGQAAAASGVPVDVRLLDRPGLRLGEAVADEANVFEADLIVVGTHGRRGIGRALLGSGAEQVIRMAPVPVLTVRSPDAPLAQAH